MKRYLRVAEGIIITTIFITFLMYPVLYAADETLPTPEEIIEKNIEAIGGLEALNKIKNKKTVTIYKNVQRNMEFKFTEYKERPNNYYQSADTGSKSGSNGKMFWEIYPSQPPRLLKGEQLSNHLTELLFDGPDGLYVPYKSMKTDCIEQINGKACYKVVKTPEKGPQRTVYYDKKSFMIVKTTTNQKENNEYSNCIEEYQKINNILFPYKIVTFFKDQKGAEYTIEKVELNIEMPEGIFDIPEEIKAIMNKNETEPGIAH